MPSNLDSSFLISITSPAFRIPDFGGGCEFDSDEWMDSLIGGGDSTYSSDAWQNTADFGLCGGDPLPACTARLISGCSPPSDLNRVQCPNSLLVPAWDPSPPQSPPPQTVLKNANYHPPSTVTVSSSSPGIDSEPELLKTLLECARLAESEPEKALQPLDKLRESVSEKGDPTKRLAFYFIEALSSRVLGEAEKRLISSKTTSEELILSYKAFNDVCPYSKFAHLTANQAILEATENASKIHIVDFGIVL